MLEFWMDGTAYVFYFLLVPCFKQPQFIQHVPMPNNDNFLATFFPLKRPPRHGLTLLGIVGDFPNLASEFSIFGMPRTPLGISHRETEGGTQNPVCPHTQQTTCPSTIFANVIHFFFLIFTPSLIWARARACIFSFISHHSQNGSKWTISINKLLF